MFKIPAKITENHTRIEIGARRTASRTVLMSIANLMSSLTERPKSGATAFKAKTKRCYFASFSAEHNFQG